MQAKTYTKEINGKTYVAQFSGLRNALRSTAQCVNESGKGVDAEKQADFIFKNVIVDPPNLDPDDFDDIDELGKVIEFGMLVMTAKFRLPEENKVSDTTIG